MEANCEPVDETMTAMLVTRAHGGDTRAFRSLYESHVQRVHALSLRLMADGAEAEDLTQDVFVVAWKQLHSYRGSARFSTWLHSITVRLSRQRFRALLRRRAREDRFSASYAEAVSVSMPDVDRQLEVLVAELPRRMRTALVLHAIEGYSQAETAGMMGISEGTVKAHVHRARALLQERLEQNG